MEGFNDNVTQSSNEILTDQDHDQDDQPQQATNPPVLNESLTERTGQLILQSLNQLISLQSRAQPPRHSHPLIQDYEQTGATGSGPPRRCIKPKEFVNGKYHNCSITNELIDTALGSFFHVAEEDVSGHRNDLTVHLMRVSVSYIAAKLNQRHLAPDTKWKFVPRVAIRRRAIEKFNAKAQEVLNIDLSLCEGYWISDHCVHTGWNNYLKRLKEKRPPEASTDDRQERFRFSATPPPLLRWHVYSSYLYSNNETDSGESSRPRSTTGESSRPRSTIGESSGIRTTNSYTTNNILTLSTETSQYENDDIYVNNDEYGEYRECEDQEDDEEDEGEEYDEDEEYELGEFTDYEPQEREHQGATTQLRPLDPNRISAIRNASKLLTKSDQGGNSNGSRGRGTETATNRGRRNGRGGLTQGGMRGGSTRGRGRGGSTRGRGRGQGQYGLDESNKNVESVGHRHEDVQTTQSRKRTTQKHPLAVRQQPKRAKKTMKSLL
ncbi:hypothetical protein INT45_005131, partial [Circinella minor]